MKTYIFSSLLFLSVIFFASCGNQTAENKTEEPKQEINTSSEQDFPNFWTAFRKAVIENNMGEIKKRTSFPLQTRGEMDGDPIVTFSENEFDNMFVVFLESPTGLNPSNFNETQKQYIQANKKITFNEYKVPMMADSVTAAITSMEFKKGDDGWKLGFLYLNEETYSKSGKAISSANK